MNVSSSLVDTSAIGRGTIIINNNDDDDDNDEFAHIKFPTNAFDDTTGTTNDDINMNDSNAEDTILDLQMTIMTMQTEQNVTIQQIQSQNKQQIRYLHNDIRKLQNEINLLRSTTNSKTAPKAATTSTSKSNNNQRQQQQQQQQHPSSHRSTTRPGSSLFARSNALISPTTNMQQQKQQQLQMTDDEDDGDNDDTRNNGNDSIGFDEQYPQQRSNNDLCLQQNNNNVVSPKVTATTIPSVSLQNTTAMNKANDNGTVGVHNENCEGIQFVYRLIQHRQRKTPTKTSNTDSKKETTSSIIRDTAILNQLIQLIASSSSATVHSSSFTEFDVIYWFINEIVLVMNVIQMSKNSYNGTNNTNISKPKIKLYNDCFDQIYTLLHWLYDALLLCNPICYNNLIEECENYSNNNNNDSNTNIKNNFLQQSPENNSNNHLHDNRRRKCSITMSCCTIPSSTTATTIHANPQEQELYSEIEEQLSNPFVSNAPLTYCTSFRTTMSNSTTVTSDASIHQPFHRHHTAFTVRRFLHDGIYIWSNLDQLYQIYSVGDIAESPNDVGTNDDYIINNNAISTMIHISTLSLQVSSVLLSYSYRPGSMNDNHFPSLIINLLRIAKHVVLQIPYSTSTTSSTKKQSNKRLSCTTLQNHEANNNDDSVVEVTSDSSRTNSMMYRNNYSRTPALRRAHIEFLEHYEGGSVNENHNLEPDYNLMDVENGLQYIAEVIHLFYTTIWSKMHYKPGRLSGEEVVWIRTKRTSCLVSIMLDLLEHYVLPDVQLYTHPLTMTSILFLHRLVDQPLVSTSSTTSNDDDNNNSDALSNYYYWRLLRTENVTTDSTAEYWHTGPTAITIVIQLFVQIVLEQMKYDHSIPNDEVLSTLLLPIIQLRDQIIRFVHCILLHVQKDRLIWDEEHRILKEQQQQVKVSKSTNGNNKAASLNNRKRMRPSLTFSIVLSDQVEVYKCTIITLLSMAPSNNERSIFTTYTDTVNSDLRSMLQLQLDEIIDDQYDKLQR